MKNAKKVISVFLVIALCLCFLSALTACNFLGGLFKKNDTKEKPGTKYYYYDGDERLDLVYILLANDGTWSDGRESGKYTLDGTVLTFMDNDEKVLDVGKLKFDIVFRSGTKYYKNPPSETDETNDVNLPSDSPELLNYYILGDEGRTLVKLKDEFDDLTKIAIPSCVTKIGNFAFDSKKTLRSVVIPGTVQEIGEYAFQYCSALSSVTLCEGIEKIGANAFSYCTSLTSIVIPNSVTRLESRAFDHCESLSELDLGQGVTYIGSEAFRHTSLISVIMPMSINMLRGSIFYECYKLETIYFYDGIDYNTGNWDKYWGYGNNADHIWDYSD